MNQEKAHAKRRHDHAAPEDASWHDHVTGLHNQAIMGYQGNSFAGGCRGPCMFMLLYNNFLIWILFYFFFFKGFISLYI